jgi:hypothetical protein
MRKEFIINTNFRRVLLSLIGISLLAFSCSTRKDNVDSSDLVAEKDIVPILTEVYMADGLLILPSLRDKYSELDSVTAYNQIIQRFGYTKEKFDRTIKYYFIKKPKELIAMYDQALGALSELESQAQKDALAEADLIKNQWIGKATDYFPGKRDSDTSSFTIKLTKTGRYTFSFTATLFPSDESFKPRLTLYTCDPDSVETGVKKYAHTIEYIKDGRPHYYSTDILVSEKAKLILKGKLYDFANLPGEWEKNAEFENISFVFSSEFI